MLNRMTNIRDKFKSIIRSVIKIIYINSTFKNTIITVFTLIIYKIVCIFCIIWYVINDNITRPDLNTTVFNRIENIFDTIVTVIKIIYMSVIFIIDNIITGFADIIYNIVCMISDIIGYNITITDCIINTILIVLTYIICIFIYFTKK
jgi:hypothetical protein